MYQHEDKQFVTSIIWFAVIAFVVMGMIVGGIICIVGAIKWIA